MVKNITSANFISDVKNAELPVVVDFFAEWCGPCREMAPGFEELSNELSGQYIFCKVDIDQERELAIDHGITSIPTMVFYKGGEQVSIVSGAMGKDELKAKIAEAFSS